MSHTYLPVVDRALALLTQASIVITDAARWAERDTSGFSPLTLIGGPMKYWKWNQAQQLVEKAAGELSLLRGKVSNLPDPSPAVLQPSVLDAIDDLFDVLPFTIRLNGTPGGPSRIKQNIGVNMTQQQRIETAKLGIDHLMSEVGLLHARLRAEATRATS